MDHTAGPLRFRAFHDMHSMFRIHIVCSLLIGLSVGTGNCQQPIAQTKLGGNTLELWSMESVSFEGVVPKRVYPFLQVHLEDMQSMKDAGKMSQNMLRDLGMNFNRWPIQKTNKLGNRLLFGMLLRDSKGKVPTASLSFSTAVRVKFDSGNEIALWPDRSSSDCLISERLTYISWSDQHLAALPLPLNSGAKRVESVEGFAIITPMEKYRFEFDLEDLRSSKRKSDGVISVVPISFKADANQTEVVLQVFRPLPKMNTKNTPEKAGKSRMDLEWKLEENIEARKAGIMTFTTCAKTESGSFKSPNLYSVSSNPKHADSESSVKAELKLRSQETESNEAASASALQKSAESLQLDVGSYLFTKLVPQKIVVTVSQTKDLETIEPFVFKDLPISFSKQRESLQGFLSTLESAEFDAKAKIETLRVWKDKSGKFTIEAQFVDSDGTKVKLQKKDGTTLDVPIEKLCDEDREFLDKL